MEHSAGSSSSYFSFSFLFFSSRIPAFLCVCAPERILVAADKLRFGFNDTPVSANNELTVWFTVGFYSGMS